MFIRLPAAIGRATLVVILVVMPSALLQGGRADSAQIVVLVALFAALFTFVEYIAASPSLVEFRNAPPFNRMRFSALFAMVLSLSMIFRGYQNPSEMTDLFRRSGAQIGQAIDFPYSPVRLMVSIMPEDASPELMGLMRDAAGMSYLIALFSIVSFILLMRLRRWPPRGGAFNVWVNLPTFDPTAGGDVVARLHRDARVNIILGFLLPFLIPVVLTLLSTFGSPIDLANPHSLIWTVTAWAFLPASIVMRGVALSRVADMIAMQRDKLRDARDRAVAGDWRLP
ncbi:MULTISPECIES: hypothetical protein [unclassified Yoonia]|uniref:hypothetical protein n=1 Tax=unclassified Yoonia TaxID=2629118 RepID=UPI002AFE3D0F|nr:MULTISPECIES: hypothetical protein [unclassified Yoonia]